MNDQELIRFASEVRRDLIGIETSSRACFAVCGPLLTLLEEIGIAARMIEGTVKYKGENWNHFWLVLADGRVLDPTADQFNDEMPRHLPAVYLGDPAGIHASPFVRSEIVWWKDGCTSRQ